MRYTLLIALMLCGGIVKAQTSIDTFSLPKKRDTVYYKSLNCQVIQNGHSLRTHIDTIKGLLKFYIHECGNQEIVVNGYRVVEISYDQDYYTALEIIRTICVATTRVLRVGIY